jgi:hypothetical protein
MKSNDQVERMNNEIRQIIFIQIINLINSMIDFASPHLRTSALLGTPSIMPVHGYYPFHVEDGGRAVPMAD